MIFDITRKRDTLSTLHLIMKRSYTVIFFLMIGHFSAAGQRLLTLDECVRIAFENSIGIQTAENVLRSTQLAHEEIGRSTLPQIKVEGKASHAPYSDHFGYDPAITNGGEYSAQVGIQKLLYDGGARGLQADQLTLDIDRLTIEQRRIKRDLRYGVTLSFADVLQAQQELTLHRQRVDELSRYLELVNRLFHGGGVNYTDVLKTQVSLENARVILQKASLEYLVAKVSLAEAMGTPLDTAFSVAGAIETSERVAVDSLFQRALVDSIHNLDLQIASLNMQRTLVNVDIARTEKLPSVSLTGDVGLLTSGDNLRLSSDQRASMVGYSVGISIENLLFNWGVTDLRVQQHQLEADNIRLGYQQLRLSLSADLQRLRSQITGSFDQLSTIDHTLTIAEDNYTLTKAQYAGGGATALEVLTAEQLLADNRLAALQTRADLRRLLAKVEQLSTY